MGCNCDSIPVKKTSCVPCKLTDDEMQNLALSWVVGGSECDTDAIKGNIPLWWDLYERQSCNAPDLRMLLVARQAATSLIGAYARQIDISNSMRLNNTRGAGKQRNEGWTRAQATASGIRFADAINKSEYNDFMNSGANSGSERNRTASNYANSGSAAHSYTRGSGQSESYRRSQGEGMRQDKSSFNRAGQGAGSSESHSDAQGNQGNTFIGFGFIGMGQTTTSGFVSGQGVANSFAINARTDNQHSFGTVNGFTQALGSSGVLTSSFGTGAGTSNASGASGSQSNDDASAFRTSQSHGEGLGTGQGNSNSQSRSSSQASSDMEGKGFTEYAGTGSGLIIADTVMAHQRVLHLQAMVKTFTDQIRELRRYRAANAGMYITFAKNACGCVETIVRNGAYCGQNETSPYGWISDAGLN